MAENNLIIPRFLKPKHKLDTIWDQLTQRSTHSKNKSYRHKRLLEDEQAAHSDVASQSSNASLNRIPLRSHSNNF
tara:strand:+ start:1314 stop:1538 length:225 start_codon:yes stop_codon:yes gene_type:complete